MKKNRPKYMQIINAAVVVIAENGFHQSQVSKIAKKAGVADGTIYLYFKNKEDILISLFKEKMGAFIDEIEKTIAEKDKATDKLLGMITAHFKVLAKDYHLAIVTQLELRQSNLALRIKINEVLKEYLKLVDKIIRFGIENGEFSSSLDVRLARQMIFGTMDETATTWVMNDHKYDLVELAPAVHRLLINGCSSHSA
ncbi:TetR/AcrR family transcriptional regulator [Bacillaceae bacterium Marseille-Q3522]|nr:TetR/AcrR family transcriptional regulator [Bacillaceae bacterium Marseille-Q3522]